MQKTLSPRGTQGQWIVGKSKAASRWWKIWICIWFSAPMYSMSQFNLLLRQYFNLRIK